MLRVLPNLEIAATGSDLEQSDRLALTAYATPVSDFVWRLEAGKLLAAIEAGRQVEEIRAFLAARSDVALQTLAARYASRLADADQLRGAADVRRAHQRVEMQQQVEVDGLHW